jgi:hypothetical protein
MRVTTPLSQIHGREEPQVSAQGGVIFMQAAVGFLGVSQQGFGIGEQTLAGFGHAHVMRVPPQQGRAALFLQRAQLAAESGLGNFQLPGAGGNAAAFHDGNEGAEQCEIFKGSHTNLA